MPHAQERRGNEGREGTPRGAAFGGKETPEEPAREPTHPPGYPPAEPPDGSGSPASAPGAPPGFGRRFGRAPVRPRKLAAKPPRPTGVPVSNAAGTGRDAAGTAPNATGTALAESTGEKQGSPPSGPRQELQRIIRALSRARNQFVKTLDEEMQALEKLAAELPPPREEKTS